MDKAGKVEYMKQTQKYIEDKQIMDIFESLTQELIINQPSNPITYLIDKIRSKKLIMHQQVYSIIGGDLQQRMAMVEKINKFAEFTVVNVQDHMQPSQYKDELYFLNESGMVKDSLIEKVKSNQKVILQGYPYDLKSSYHLQKSGVIPTKIFVISNDKEQIEHQINDYLKEHQEVQAVKDTKKSEKKSFEVVVEQKKEEKVEAKVEVKEEEKKEEEKKEEIDIDLEDKDVQKSAGLIQMQYRKKQERKRLEAQRKQEKLEKEKIESERKQQQQEEIDIDLEDKDVQNSALLIQAQYRKKQQKQKIFKKQEEERLQKEAEFKKKRGDVIDIDIDLEDKGVQKSATLIQAQYRKKQQRLAATEKREKKIQARKEAKEAAAKKAEEEEVDIDLEDKGVQKSAGLIQAQYRKKQQRLAATKKREAAIQAKKEAKEAAAKKAEEEEVDIDLEDKGVQKSATLIQAQYRKKQQRLAASQKREQKIKERLAEEAAKKASQPQEEEVDIDLNDKDVQKSASMIQAQFRKKKQNKVPQKQYGARNEQVTLYAYTYMKNIEDVQKANEDMHTVVSGSDITSIQSIIGLRNRSSVPLRALRILIVRPSNLKERVNDLVSFINGNLDLTRVNSWKLIEKQISKKTEIGKFADSVTKRSERVPDDILSALIYSEINHVKAKKHGIVMEGFPKTQSQFNIFKSWKIVPHLVVIMDDDDFQLASNYMKVSHQKSSGLKGDNIYEGEQQYDCEQIKDKVAGYRETIEMFESYYEEHKIMKVSFSESDQEVMDRINTRIGEERVYS